VNGTGLGEVRTDPQLSQNRHSTQNGWPGF
jgi:hypothetical protein